MTGIAAMMFLGDKKFIAGEQRIEFSIKLFAFIAMRLFSTVNLNKFVSGKPRTIAYEQKI